VHATFGDDDVVGDDGERTATGADVASVRSAVKFEANLVMKFAMKPAVRYAVRYVPK
jgi:hypothetical protein